jgi:hypothetical protein
MPAELATSYTATTTSLFVPMFLSSGTASIKLEYSNLSIAQNEVQGVNRPAVISALFFVALCCVYFDFAEAGLFFAANLLFSICLATVLLYQSAVLEV